MAKKDINSKKFNEATKIKLDIFRDFFKSWLTVFINLPYINSIYVYDVFAGSGKDVKGAYGSPLILIDEAQRLCEKDKIDKSAKKLIYGFNEFLPDKFSLLTANAECQVNKCKEKHLNSCGVSCIINDYYAQKNFDDLFEGERFKSNLKNTKIAKFILMDQYGYKYINDNIFKGLIEAPKTDFIFFISSSYLKRFKTENAVTNYFDIEKLDFPEDKPHECHKAVHRYYLSLIPKDKEYYLHHFTIKNGANYWGLIFGTNHSLGMEKFVQTCWKFDTKAGEANFPILGDLDDNSLFKDEPLQKEVQVSKKIREKLLNGKINTNICGLKYTLREGCKPQLFNTVLKDLVKENLVKLERKKFESVNIHKIQEYRIDRL